MTFTQHPGRGSPQLLQLGFELRRALAVAGAF